ncbi:hypothetical protein QBC47DRAFT_30957 [Echria macrotheca]|uniref:Sulfotransferase family protein n=1 Tax=Echria macrotheca TaxID=438768 RepID=A0AAJ0FHX5_9PEZI|nr:hypothetical protein QBC47DRAFT_30957 [Echria macrotheca]
MAGPEQNAHAKNSRRLFLVSIPRTASNLLVRVLDIKHQPNLFANDKSGYFFLEAFTTATYKGYYAKSIVEWTDDEKSEIRSLFQDCLDQMEECSAEARSKGKIMFTKEHAFWFVNPATMLDADGDHESRVQQDDFRLNFPDYGPTQTFSPNNKTVFPDEYLRTWQFAFLIRHPALAWPSMYRAMRKMAKDGFIDDRAATATLLTNMTWRWTRYLYDWCSAEHAKGCPAPLLLDARDVVHDRDVVMRFCDEAGLDRNALRFEWDDAEPGYPGAFSGREKAVADIMMSSLQSSRGVIKDKTPGRVDIDAEVETWKAEFGDEAAALLEKTVRAAMPDYEYLRERCVKA